MSLKTLRDRLFQRLDWAPTASTEATTRANAFINEAVQQLVKDCPFACFESKIDFGVEAAFVSSESSLTGDTVSVYSTGGVPDYWVLQRDATIDITALPTTNNLWGKSYRAWDGWWIEYVYNSRTYRAQIRTTWSAQVSGNTYREYMSVVNPQLAYDGDGDEVYALAAPYRVFMNPWPLPRGIVAINSVRMRYSGESRPLQPIRQDDAEDAGYLDVGANVASGRPRAWWRERTDPLPAPTVAPGVSTSAGGTWGPSGATEAAGTFQYVYTYVWGIRHEGPLERDSQGLAVTGGAAFWEPLWESAPSPASSAVSTTWGGNQILVALPDTDHLLGFGHAASMRYQHSGLFKRIYRKRTALVSGGGNQNVPLTSDYQLLYEVASTVTSFPDTGLDVPDFHRRLSPTLPWTGNHLAIGFWPRPDASYRLDIRAVMQPPPLINDYDAPTIDDAAWTAILDWAEFRFRSALKDESGAMMARRHYEDVELPTLSQRYGSGQPSSTVGSRRQAAVTRMSAAPRKWY